MNRAIWKTDKEFANELHVSIHQFRRMKAKYMRDLPFLKITRKRIPATCHYELDFKMMNELIAAQADIKATQTPPKTHPPEASDNHRLRKSAQSRLRESAQSITENIFSENTKKQTTAKPVVVDSEISQIKTTADTLTVHNSDTVDIDKNISKKAADAPTKNPLEAHTAPNTDIATDTKANEISVDVFKGHERKAARKYLSVISFDEQMLVMAVITLAITNQQVTKSRIGYLRRLIGSVQDGTFTPVEPEPKQSAGRGNKKQTLADFVRNNPSKTTGKSEKELVSMMKQAEKAAQHDNNSDNVENGGIGDSISFAELAAKAREKEVERSQVDNAADAELRAKGEKIMAMTEAESAAYYAKVEAEDRANKQAGRAALAQLKAK